MSELPPPPIDATRARRVLLILGLGTLGAFAAAISTRMPEARPPAAVPARIADPMMATLLRCHGLGDRALADTGCRAAWAEHRRRFMAREARP